jgi:hypothetical protein
MIEFLKRVAFFTSGGYFVLLVIYSFIFSFLICVMKQFPSLDSILTVVEMSLIASLFVGLMLAAGWIKFKD